LRPTPAGACGWALNDSEPEIKMLQHQTQISVNRDRVIRRRDFVKTVSLGSLAAGAFGWSDLMSLQAADLKKRGRACILLWMSGGPSQFETFSPKPGHANSGETKAISTSVPGIEYSENLPQLAKVANRISVIRSMTSKEGSHNRGTALLNTGYLPTANIKYPGLGALVAQQNRNESCELPDVVQVGTSIKNLFNDGGFLGVDYDPFVVADASRMPNNSQITTDSKRFNRRLDLVDRLSTEFASADGKKVVEEQAKVNRKAASMILSPQMKSFDLSHESQSMRNSYGQTAFGNACLLARRLVETGVSFVEVVSDSWDSHHDNFNKHREKTAEIDQPFARLITDLDDRGMLDTTMVIWMGEFGRTPRINPRGGRDHYPAAFTIAMAGAGIKPGQVIGATDAGGSRVTDRRVRVPDLYQSICHGLKLKTDQENTSASGRDIKVVDGGEVVTELF
jgi:hypothetical protein